MQTPTQIKSSIIKFLFFKIEFDSDLNSFVYKNREPLNEINEDFFEPELGEIFKNIVNNLQVGKENLVFLKDLEDIINKKTKHFEMFKMNSFDDVDVYLKNLKEEQFNKDFLFMLDSNEEKTIEVDEANKNEFIRVFNLAKNYSNILYQFVDGLIVDFDHIDFNEFDFDEYIKSHNIEPIYENGNHLKCVVNLKKIDVAHLFKMLLDEGIFYFSENERKNKILLKTVSGNNLAINNDIKTIFKEYWGDLVNTKYSSATKKESEENYKSTLKIETNKSIDEIKKVTIDGSKYIYRYSVIENPDNNMKEALFNLNSELDYDITNNKTWNKNKNNFILVKNKLSK